MHLVTVVLMLVCSSSPVIYLQYLQMHRNAKKTDQAFNPMTLSCRYTNILFIWIHHHYLTGIKGKGNHPQVALIQISEIHEVHWIHTSLFFFTVRVNDSSARKQLADSSEKETGEIERQSSKEQKHRWEEVLKESALYRFQASCLWASILWN